MNTQEELAAKANQVLKDSYLSEQATEAEKEILVLRLDLKEATAKLNRQEVLIGRLSYHNQALERLIVWMVKDKCPLPDPPPQTSGPIDFESEFNAIKRILDKNDTEESETGI